MSQYTDNMVAELQRQESWNFEQAADFAATHALSTRSVVSKIKSLEIDYTPKSITRVASDKPRKADIIADIASSLKINQEAIEGLNRAPMLSLKELRNVLARRG
jgi:hypothetical protein